MSGIGSFLEGVRILDLSQYIPGPFASLMLADMGAEVLKIEPPGGDPMQDLGPRNGSGGGLFYDTLNAGKSVMRLDLKSDEDRARLLELAADADVLIEGFRPGVMDRLGVGYDRLKSANAALVYCALSGYGATGDKILKAGHDANYLAEAGVLDRNGDSRPMYFDPPVADYSGSLFAAIAILGALNGRHRTGAGCMIDVALADVIMPMQLLQIADWSANAAVPQRGGTYLNGGAAYYNVYETADGRFVVVGAVEPKFWRTFCLAAGHPEWIARQHEAITQVALIADVAAYMRQLTLGACLERFADDDCCVSAVIPINEAVAADRVKARGLVREDKEGRLQALLPVLVDGVPPKVRASLRQCVKTAIDDDV
jgi:crotonobetainyl-CoA:carnitine CoA-transferase CaiB-like acyl-CoA transferase